MQGTGDYIHVGSAFTLELSVSPQGGQVLVKYPTAALPPAKVIARLERELTVGSIQDIRQVRRVLGRTQWRGLPAIELEFIPGETFKSYFARREHRRLEHVLQLALSAATALEALHAAGIVHRDIAASNLLVREDSSEAVIIDLGLATRHSDEDSFVFAVEGQLPYLSPEQTGRIDLPVDTRSDLYSFGVILYEMLVGALPFAATDSLGWIHAHLARSPEPPFMRVPELPRMVSDIAMRLLEKLPERRYQTARGLCRDLRRCLDQIRAVGDIGPFSLGLGDHRGQLIFATTLYGRDREQRELHQAFERAQQGEPGVMFISGVAGSGKSALVSELAFPVAAQGGRYVRGKFDQVLRGIPYAAFGEAFSQLCRQVLGGTTEELDAFRARVLETLGANAALLLELVPELETVIGIRPALPVLDTVETANRFAVTLLGFFHCMVEEDKPLVLFLDDLQWADAASLELLRMIVTRTARSRFLIIGAYRTEELPASAPLRALLDGLPAEWKNVSHLALKGLSLAQAQHLVSDALHMSAAEVAPLVSVLHAKTGGNPFFLRQILESLVSDGILRFVPASESWAWDALRINALDISDNIIELMVRRVSRLAAETRAALQVAACVGNTFALELLVVGKPDLGSDPRSLLRPAVDSGLVALLDGSARFTHDRIQQAVLQMLSVRDQQQIHLRLGRHLLQRQRGREHLLAAVQQLNLGASLIHSVAERNELAQANLEAGNVAKAAMAYAAARDFYTQGEHLLDASNSDTAHLYFELRLHRTECEFYTGEVELAIGHLRELLPQAPDIAASAIIYQLLIDSLTVELKLGDALKIGAAALAELGFDLPQGQAFAALLERVKEIDALLAERDVERMQDWPEMRDERELAVMALMTHLTTPAYIAASDMFPHLAVAFAQRSLQGGLSPYASFGFAVYGMLLANALQRYEQARAVGRLATDIAQHPGHAPLRTRVNFYYATFMQHWCEPLEATLPYLDDGWRAGIETGDLQFASYCVNHIHGNGLWANQSLVELEQSFGRFADVNRLLRQEDGQHFFLLLQHTIEALRRPQENTPQQTLEEGLGPLIKIWADTGNATLSSFHNILLSLLALVFEQPEQALAAAERALPVLGGVAGMTWLPHHHFLHALALSENCRQGTVAREQALERLHAYRQQFATWAVTGAANYRPMLLLIEAELAELDGADHGVMLDAYDAAINAAAEYGRTLDEALGCERAARYWLRQQKRPLAQLYLQRALHAYDVWGAGAKVVQLARDYGSVLAGAIGHDNETSSASSTGVTSSEGLHSADIDSVVKAAQAIAGELVIDRMLARLIRIVLETAAAQSGYLLLEQNDEWCVVAAQYPERETSEVLQWRPVREYPQIAASVVNYVAHTHQTVNLDDAAKSAQFAGDASLAARHCKSLLCLPIINRGELAGILYMENNLTTHAFTRTQTRILQLLMTQAISSLEISRYFARLQNLNRALEEEVDERKRTASRLEFLANHDALTGLPNRRLLYDRVEQSLRRVKRSGDRVAVLFLDIDQFKNINDTLSHQVGDHLLQQVAQRLASHIREGDTLGRLGGDEYVLLMEGRLVPTDLSAVADKLLATFREPFHVDGHDLYTSTSIGISLYPDDAADTDQLLRNADAAMYQAKQQGRNTYHFYSARLAKAAAERLTLERDLRRALENDELELYFQPQVALADASLVGAEVLLRWNHPQRGMLLPGYFIPLAEESGLIIALGEWVLRQACLRLEAWQRQGMAPETLAINVSGLQFSLHGAFVHLLQSVLHELSVDPARLEIELTESVIMDDSEYASFAVNELNAMGVRLAIDDFGTGYSSLSYLHRLPVHRLKIDQSFVRELPYAQESATMVKLIIDLGNSLGKYLIAEGIETEEQRLFLQRAGCPSGQGYLFGRPMPLAEFEALLASRRVADRP